VKEPSGKMKDAFGFVGSITEQEISFVRTVYSYVGQKKTLKRFSSSHESYICYADIPILGWEKRVAMCLC